MQLPWNDNFLPEALIASAVAGIAAGVIGGLLGAGLRGKLPRPGTARVAFGASLLAIIVVIGTFLVTDEPGGLPRARSR